MAVARQAVPPYPAPVPPPVRAGWGRRAALVVGFAALTLAPIGIAVLRTPRGHVFTGYVVIARDAFVYQALWRSGWHGAWLFHPLFSGEPQPGLLIYAWYLWTGHLVGGIPGPWLYHATRVGAGIAALAAVWSLVSTLYRPAVMRRSAMILASLGGGIGVMLGTGARLGPIALRPTEVLVSGTSLGDIVSMAPHLGLATALLCWTLGASLRWVRAPRPRWLVVAMAAPLGLALIYPQMAVLALTTLLAYAILRRRFAAFIVVGLAAAAVAPYFGYLAWAQRLNPGAFVGVGATAQVPFHFDIGDPLGFLLLSHLIASGLILVAIRAGRLRGDLLLPAAWIVIMTVFMFTPGVQSVVGRSYLASSVPFGILAAAGLPPLLRRMQAGRSRRRVALGLLAASSVFGIFSLIQPYAIALERLDPNAEYERGGEATLLEWFAPRSSARDLVLTTYLDGVFVPAQTGARAYVGHPDQTVGAVAKAASALAFFGEWDAARRDAFLRTSQITVVLAGDPAAVERLRHDPHLRVMAEADGEALLAVTS